MADDQVIPGVDEYAEGLQVPYEHSKLFREPKEVEDVNDGDECGPGLCGD